MTCFDSGDPNFWGLTSAVLGHTHTHSNIQVLQRTGHLDSSATILYPEECCPSKDGGLWAAPFLPSYLYQARPGQETDGNSNRVIWGELNKGTIYKGVGRMQGNHRGSAKSNSHLTTPRPEVERRGAVTRSGTECPLCFDHLTRALTNHQGTQPPDQSSDQSSEDTVTWPELWPIIKGHSHLTRALTNHQRTQSPDQSADQSSEDTALPMVLPSPSALRLGYPLAHPNQKPKGKGAHW